MIKLKISIVITTIFLSSQAQAGFFDKVLHSFGFKSKPESLYSEIEYRNVVRGLKTSPTENKTCYARIYSYGPVGVLGTSFNVAKILYFRPNAVDSSKLFFAGEYLIPKYLDSFNASPKQPGQDKFIGLADASDPRRVKTDDFEPKLDRIGDEFDNVPLPSARQN